MTDKDLIVLAADKDMQSALAGLLRTRRLALGIRTVTFDILVHSQHDPACARQGVSFLQNYAKDYHHGLLVFDHEGCGRESDSPEALQRELDQQFSSSAWGERAKAIVIDPELEAWVWSRSPHVATVTGWSGRSPSLRDWLVSRDLLRRGQSKPDRPKEALHAALREAGVARSASVYEQLAEKVSVRNCADRSFGELKATLSAWFPAGHIDGQHADG